MPFDNTALLLFQITSSTSLLLLEMILVLSSTPCHSVSSDLFNALEEALLNDTSNLIKLQLLFYPPGYFSGDTVEIHICGCNFTVNSIKNEMVTPYSITPYSNYIYWYHNTEDQSRSAFLKVKGGSKYYFANNSVTFHLSDNSDSNEQFKSFIVRSYLVVVQTFEYISFYLFYIITLVRFNHPEYHSPGHYDNIDQRTIKFYLNELERMPSYAEVIETLASLFSWVRKLIVKFELTHIEALEGYMISL